MQTKYSSFDPLIVIRTFDENGNIMKTEPVKFIGDDKSMMFKYLGMLIQYDLGSDVIKANIEKALTDMLLLVDETLLTGAQKA
jgi:hypothetical protein